MASVQAITDATFDQQESTRKQQEGDWGGDIVGDQVGAGPRAEEWGDPHDGNQTGAGTRETCPQTDYPLVALIPEDVNWSLTTQATPTFWFYIPYSSDQIASAAFVLEDEAGDIYYEIPIALPDSSGFYHFTLPDAVSLQPEIDYRWAFKLFCSQDSIVPIFVNGWVQFSEENVTLPTDYQTYIDNRIWLDAVDSLMQQRVQNPDDMTLFKDWQVLMLGGGLTPTEIPAGPIQEMPLMVNGEILSF